MDNTTLKSFDYINKFVGDLCDTFGSKQHSLLLYNRLLGKTSLKHGDSIRKHVKSFSEFCQKNHQAIMKKDATILVNPIISYSKKVNIKMDEIFKMSDSETTSVIWQHLLVITNSIDPSEEAMEILKKSLEEKSNEGEFFSNLVKKIENNVDPNSNDPMSAIMGLMNSGVFTDLISNMNSGMQDGSLNIGKLFGTVQGMMATMGGMGGMGDTSSSNNKNVDTGSNSTAMVSSASSSTSSTSSASFSSTSSASSSLHSIKEDSLREKED